VRLPVRPDTVGVSERFMAAVVRTVEGASLPWVRIYPSPPSPFLINKLGAVPRLSKRRAQHEPSRYARPGTACPSPQSAPGGGRPRAFDAATLKNRYPASRRGTSSARRCSPGCTIELEFHAARRRGARSPSWRSCPPNCSGRATLQTGSAALQRVHFAMFGSVQTEPRLRVSILAFGSNTNKGTRR